MLLDDPIVRAPEFTTTEWLNTFAEITMASLRGKIVLIDFWEHTCINCIRTLPYLRTWHERYSDSGLNIIGVHTPEFRFGRDPQILKSALGRLGIRWPVVLDNDQELWTAYANKVWPSVYLIDSNGYIRYHHAGEGAYAITEAAIQALLRQIQPDVDLPDPLPALRPEDIPGAVCYPTTPELHIDALGDPSPLRQEQHDYSLPADMVDGHFYLEGTWRNQDDGLILEAPDGAITLPYHAAAVQAVLAPCVDPTLLTRYYDNPTRIEITQDGRPLPSDRYGEDVLQDLEKTIVRVDTPRTYFLVNNPTVSSHQMRIEVVDPGFVFYAFSFGSCLSNEQNHANHVKE